METSSQLSQSKKKKSETSSRASRASRASRESRESRLTYSSKGEKIDLNLCSHIEGSMLNDFLVKDFVLDSGRIPRFFASNYNQIPRYKSIFNSFSMQNLCLDFTLIHNRSQTLSPSRDGCIFTMAFDSNEEHLASSNHLNQIEVWDFTSRNLIKTITDHKEIVTCIEYFNQPQMGVKEMMTCSLDKTIKLWKDYTNVHTFTEHSDWVRCLAINRDNKYFLSGCVSSVVKLWDLNTAQVVRSIKNHNPDPDLLNTVNSLQFTHNGDTGNIFLCGLRSGSVKIFDLRQGSFTKGLDGIESPIKEFKAHRNKLNSVKFSGNDSHLLSSGRDSLIRLWDYRKLPNSDDIDYNVTQVLQTYQGHQCKGFNIEANFFLNHNYVLSGSEDSCIYVWETNTGKLSHKYKTDQKCVNLVKPRKMKNRFSFAFTGLEESAIFVYSNNKVLSKKIEKLNSNMTQHTLNNNFNSLNSGDSLDISNKNSYNIDSQSDSDKDEDFDDTSFTSNVQTKIIEEIMSECGDLILRIFHQNNLTYSNGVNFEQLLDIIQRNNDQESLRIMQTLNEKFLKKLMESFINESKNKKQPDKYNKEKSSKTVHKTDVNLKCLLCKKAAAKNLGLFNYDQFVENELMLECEVEPLLDLPNNHMAFSAQNQSETQMKTFYSNESQALKYNYHLNKYI